MDLLTSRVALANALSGSAADSFSTVLLFPLDAIKINMQADSSRTALQVMQHTFEDGVGPVYKGCDSKVLAGFQQKFQYFYVYALLKDRLGKRFPGIGADLVFGYLSALQGLGTTLPLEVTNTRIITSRKGGKSAGFIETFKNQLETEGFASFYRTLSASAILCINPAISYTVFERLKARILERRGAALDSVLTTLEAFWAGVLSKLFATIITFPFIRAKVMMSVWKKRNDEEADLCENPKEAADMRERSQPGMVDTMKSIVEIEGFLGLYKGLQPQVVKAVTNAAIMLSMKEKIYGLVKGLILGPAAHK